MPEKFLSIPDQLMGEIVTPQEAVDWLAFGPPRDRSRTSLSAQDQIQSAHKAAGVLLLALWSSDLPAYVRSPSLATWFEVPAIYWDRQTSDTIESSIKRPEIPDRLPGLPRPLDPRYGFDVPKYPHPLPASDLVGQAVVFRRDEIERHCAITGPVVQWKCAEINEEPELPPGAKPNDHKHLQFARHAAKWLRAHPNRKLSEALRDSYQHEPAHRHNAIDKAARQAFSLVYDRKGQPLKNS